MIVFLCILRKKMFRVFTVKPRLNAKVRTQNIIQLFHQFSNGMMFCVFSWSFSLRYRVG